ncbi:MAG: SDR family oxidoreductase [Anaerolineales bacterium]|nr:SDR family oxidoreductase [Anaerolineales bacterium]
MILVVGATGQLGTAVIRRLMVKQLPVRAFVRQASHYQHLQDAGVELAFGDLCDPVSIERACQGVEVVIATANTTIPQGKYNFAAIEDQGYQHLIAACQRHGVKQFVFMSVAVTPFDEAVLTFRFKRRTEERLKKSGLSYTIFRGSLFMDDWFAFIGSYLPLRGAEAATIRRDFWFSKLFIKGVGNLIEKRGIALIPGPKSVRHAFIALDDVAEFIVASLGHPQAQKAIFSLGGPEILTWGEIVAHYENVLGRPVRAVYLPSGIFRFQRMLLRPFSEAASNLMGLNWIVGYDTPFEMRETAAIFGVTLTHAGEFLREKASLPGQTS